MRFSFFLLLISLSMLSCGQGEERVNIRLTMAERSGLDTRIVAHMDSLRPLLEMRCEEERADRVAITTDSIVQRRLEEEARLRSRIPQMTGQ